MNRNRKLAKNLKFNFTSQRKAVKEAKATKITKVAGAVTKS